MMSTSTQDPKDQATGLRQLFAASSVPVHVLCCPSRPALVAPLAQLLSQDLAVRGHTVAWIDEIDLSEREEWPLPGTVRFDVGQALEGHVDLSAAMQALKPQLFFGLSCKTRKLLKVERPLQSRLLTSGVRFDTMVIAGHPDIRPDRYAASAHYTAITNTDAESLQNTLQWMLRIEALQLPRSLSVVIAGKGARTQSSMKWLEEASNAHCSQPVKLLGLATPKTMTDMLPHAWAGQLDLLDVLMHHLLTQ